MQMLFFILLFREINNSITQPASIKTFYISHFKATLSMMKIAGYDDMFIQHTSKL